MGSQKDSRLPGAALQINADSSEKIRAPGEGPGGDRAFWPRPWSPALQDAGRAPALVRL